MKNTAKLYFALLAASAVEAMAAARNGRNKAVAEVSQAEVKVGDSLACSVQGETGVHVYRWYVATKGGATLVQTSLSPVLVITPRLSHSKVYCDVTSVDGKKKASPSDSASVENSAPELFSASVSIRLHNVSCVGGTTDKDGDEIRYSYHWFGQERVSKKFVELQETTPSIHLEELSGYTGVGCYIEAGDGRDITTSKRQNVFLATAAGRGEKDLALSPEPLVLSR